MAKKNKPSNGRDTPNVRDEIARSIFFWVILFTGALGVIGVALGAAVLFIKPEETGIVHSKEILQYIFTALLPLWGTWIGTVLAYYFSKENFAAANEQVRQLVSKVTGDDRLRSKKVTDVMMAFEKIKRINIPIGGGNAPPAPAVPPASPPPGGNPPPPTPAAIPDDPDLLKVRYLYDEVVKMGVHRALIFKDKKIIYVLHKSLLGEFLLRVTDNPNATIADMKKDQNNDLKNAFQTGVQTISKDATLLDVKTKMDNLPSCQDVFVTETGKKDEDVLGWITNIDLMNYSEA